MQLSTSFSELETSILRKRGASALNNRSVAAPDYLHNVLGMSQGHFEMLCAYMFSERQQLRKRHVTLILPSTKEVAYWVEFFDGLLRGYNVSSSQSKPGVSASLPSYYVIPSFSLYGTDRFVNSGPARKQRIQASANILSDTPAIFLTTLAGLFQKTLNPESLGQMVISLKRSDEWDQDQLAQNLTDLGYSEVQTITDDGTFCFHGSVLEVFPVNHNDPIRIEFHADEIGGIRQFDLDTQSSTLELEECRIYPVYDASMPNHLREEQVQILYNELLERNMAQHDREGMIKAFQQGVYFAGFDMFTPLFRSEKDRESCLWHYFTDQDLILFPSTLASCDREYQAFYQDLEQQCQIDSEGGRAVLPVDWHFVSPGSLNLQSEAVAIEFGNPYSGSATIKFGDGLDQHIDKFALTKSFNAFKKSPSIEEWCNSLSAFQEEFGASSSTQSWPVRLLFLIENSERLERLTSILLHRNIPFHKVPGALFDVFDQAKENGKSQPTKAQPKLHDYAVNLAVGYVSQQLYSNDLNCFVFPDEPFFGKLRSKPKIKRSAKVKNFLSSLKEIKSGDLVVHIQHGIGRYLGMTTLAVAGHSSDFMVLEYADGDKVYLPVDRLSLLQKYASSVSDDGDKRVTLDRLGGQQWDKRKSSVKKAVKDMAEELIKIHAKRSLLEGHVYGPPDETYLEFEASFPYEETTDQLQAIQDVEQDLRSATPMDRLICGDVGFGKTEVALRAAMRTVLDGYQVLVLVPTTVLCYQHYRTFLNRLSRYGVRVEQINRFVSPSQARAVVSALANGSLDILVGTHRVLSKDIKPSRLGLIIVDEEQRFGVSHKEILKRLKPNVDILTLTATPIPRTLHMSMVGLKDVSIIASPPQDRRPVKTLIGEYQESLIKEAIEKEVGRGGQVFFIHNRVEDIELFRSSIQKLVPRCEIRVAHGQMREHQLEKVIVDFLEQKFPVLLCTTIIESGIDMPNVNTLIVNRADRFGLAQLYQLRGRVGRADVQAYAYFLTPPQLQISEEAQKRLDVLATYQDLGAGFQIASHDLEIRGAGNLLGGEQTGHIGSVGIEMYTDLLEQAISELRGQVRREDVDPEIKIPIDAFIPLGFVPKESERLQIYKQLFAVRDHDELDLLLCDLKDRLGTLPRQFSNLLKIAKLKLILRRCRVSKLTIMPKDLCELRFSGIDEAQAQALMAHCRQHPMIFHLTKDFRLLVSTQPVEESGSDSMSELQEQDHAGNRDILRVLECLIQRLLPLDMQVSGGFS